MYSHNSSEYTDSLKDKLPHYYVYKSQTNFKRQEIIRTGAKVKTHATEELVASDAVVIPDGELEATLGQLLQTYVLVDKRVVPDGRARRAAHDARLLLAGSTFVR